VRGIVIAVALTACGDVEVGGPCSLDDPCDDGAVCNLSADGSDGRAGICIVGSGDIDGDGLRNDKDFCNAKPGGQFDEDLDGIGDDCDPCPIARPPAIADADGDAVDSPCDPDASAAGDAIAVFDGFNAGMPSGWKTVGMWDFRGGEVIATANDPTMFATLLAPLPLVTTKLAVLAQYRIDRVDTTATQNFAGVTTVDRRPAGVSVVQCGGHRAGNVDSVLLDTDTGAMATPLESLFDTAGRYRVAQRTTGAQAGCALQTETAMGAAQQSTGGESPTEGGLVAKAVTARFQYLLVVQRP
jgi:hypothetical protein